MTMVKEKHQVISVDEKTRINDYLVDVFKSLPSKKSIKKALKKGIILVDGKSVSSALWVEAEMKIELLEDNTMEHKVYSIELEVIFEDDFLAIINKPSGLLSSGNQFRTLQNALVGNLSPSTQIDAINPPKLVHRLDSSTSGLIIVAKTAGAVKLLGDLLADKKIKKKYIALVKGKPEDQGSIKSKIERKEAKSDFKRIETAHSNTLGPISWIELFPHTGRTHQLRIHMAENNNPILGDRIYGDKENDIRGKGLFLAAIALDFQHPITNESLKIEIPNPKKFDKYWFGIKNRNSSMD